MYGCDSGDMEDFSDEVEDLAEAWCEDIGDADVLVPVVLALSRSAPKNLPIGHGRCGKR